MGRTKHFPLTGSLSQELLKAFKEHVAARERGFVQLEAEREGDDEDVLFADTDAALGRGDGFFSFDERERESRRLDMRTPLDFDPGPIEMEEAPEDAADHGVVIEFAGRSQSEQGQSSQH